MKVLRVLKVTGVTAVVITALYVTSFTHAVSSTASSKIKDFQLVHSDGGKVRRSHVSIAIRRGYPGVIPKIRKRVSVAYPNCYDVKFIYDNELRRLTFNCGNSHQQLTMMTR